VHDTQAEFDEWQAAQTPDYVTNFGAKTKPAADSTKPAAAPMKDSTVAKN